MKEHPKTEEKRSGKALYTAGLNDFIDSLCNPSAKVDKDFILVDGILNGLIEQNLPVSVGKFVKSGGRVGCDENRGKFSSSFSRRREK
jgi:hypothetical protein